MKEAQLYIFEDNEAVIKMIIKGRNPMMRHVGSAASTVSGSTGSGGSTGNFVVRVTQNTFVASRIELKGWRCWSTIRGTSITQDGAEELIIVTKARNKQDDLNVFDGD